MSFINAHFQTGLSQTLSMSATDVFLFLSLRICLKFTLDPTKYTVSDEILF